MNYQVLITAYFIRQFDEDIYFFRDVDYHYLNNLRYNPYLFEIKKIVHHRIILEIFKNVFGDDYLPKQKDLIKQYFCDEISKASEELNYLRSNFSCGRE